MFAELLNCLVLACALPLSVLSTATSNTYSLFVKVSVPAHRFPSSDCPILQILSTRVADVP